VALIELEVAFAVLLSEIDLLEMILLKVEEKLIVVNLLVEIAVELKLAVQSFLIGVDQIIEAIVVLVVVH